MSDGPIETAFVIGRDNREQLGYLFEGFKADASEGNRPLVVRVEDVTLQSGDYSLIGYQDQVAIERKSFEDLFSTLGQGRERFVRELERLNEMDFAAVVCEVGWREVAFHRPVHSRMSSKSVVRSILAWSQRYIRVHWFMAGDRRMGEAITFRLLERYYKDQMKRAAAQAERAVA